MKLSRGSRRKIEEFFKEYLGDDDFKLPKTYFFAGKFASILARTLQIHGITIGPFIYIAPKLLYLNKNDRKSLPEDLIVHEIAHVLQYKKYGFFGFLWKYFGDYWKNLRRLNDRSRDSKHQAYLEIPFEEEARRIASNYVKWVKARRANVSE